MYLCCNNNIIWSSIIRIRFYSILNLIHLDLRLIFLLYKIQLIFKLLFLYLNIYIFAYTFKFIYIHTYGYIYIYIIGYVTSVAISYYGRYLATASGDSKVNLIHLENILWKWGWNIFCRMNSQIYIYIYTYI